MRVRSGLREVISGGGLQWGRVPGVTVRLQEEIIQRVVYHWLAAVLPWREVLREEFSRIPQRRAPRGWQIRRNRRDDVTGVRLFARIQNLAWQVYQGYDVRGSYWQVLAAVRRPLRLAVEPLGDFLRTAIQGE